MFISNYWNWINYLKSWIERISSTSNEVKLSIVTKDFFIFKNFIFEINDRSDTGKVINRIQSNFIDGVY